MIRTSNIVLHCIWFLAALVLLPAGCKNRASDQPDTAKNGIPSTGFEAIDRLSEQIAENPGNPELYFARSRAFYEEEGYDEAIADLNKALEIDSTNVDYLHLLADVYLDYYKSRLALETMNRAAKLHPERIPTLLKLSEFQHILHRHDPSMRTIEKILQLDPQNSEAFFMLGMNFKEIGDTTRAINSFQTAVDFNPDLVDAWMLLGKLYAARNNPFAVKYFDNAIRLDTANMEARMAKANYYFLHDQAREALQEYRAITSINPQFADAYYNAGLVYMEQKDYNKAYEHFNLAVQMAPTFSKAYYYRGYASELGGNLDDARQDYEQALRLEPNNPEYETALESLKKEG